MAGTTSGVRIGPADTDTFKLIWLWPLLARRILPAEPCVPCHVGKTLALAGNQQLNQTPALFNEVQGWLIAGMTMRPKSPDSTEEAEVLALKALVFLAAEPDRLSRFMELSGLGLDTIRASAGDPAFLGGLLDHMLADQSLLLIFAEEHGLKPDRIGQLRRKLPGAHIDF
jgi:hypothetical protein